MNWISSRWKQHRWLRWLPTIAHPMTHLASELFPGSILWFHDRLFSASAKNWNALSLFENTMQSSCIIASYKHNSGVELQVPLNNWVKLHLPWTERSKLSWGCKESRPWWLPSKTPGIKASQKTSTLSCKEVKTSSWILNGIAQHAELLLKRLRSISITLDVCLKLTESVKSSVRRHVDREQLRNWDREGYSACEEDPLALKYMVPHGAIR